MRKDWHDKLAWTGFALGIFLIVLQGTLTVPARMAEGGGLWRALVFYFSYFTIWTNVGLVLVYFATASGRRRIRFLAGPTARTLMAGSILVVMLIYATLLAPMWSPMGLMRLTDAGLHYVTPILYLAWWLIGPHPVPLRWDRARVMMLYPLSYIAWVIGRGLAIDRWPYPFVHVPDLGWPRAIANMAGLAIVFLLAYLAVIGITRLRHGRARYGKLKR